MTLEYYNAYFQRVKKMPKLETILKKIDKPAGGMTDEAMFEMVKQLDMLMNRKFAEEVK